MYILYLRGNLKRTITNQKSRYFAGYSQEFLMGAWRPVLQIPTLSVIKKRRFSTPLNPLSAVATLSSKSFASESGKGEALGMSLVRWPKPA